MKEFYFGGNHKAYYLYYYFKHPTDDYISHQLLDFKANSSVQKKLFTEIASKSFKEQNLTFQVVIRALGSRELTASKETPLSQLCEGISSASNAVCLPGFLKKNHITEPLKKLNLAQRRLVLSEAYAINIDYDLNYKKVLIVDDISTTGSSFAAIASCIKKSYANAQIFGFCLAKTKSLEFDHVSGNEEQLVETYKTFYKQISSH